MQREKRATLISPNTEEARAVEALAKDGQHPKGSGETEEKGHDADDNNKHERQHEQASEANIKPPSHHKKAKAGDAGKYLEDHEAKYGKRDMTNQIPGQLEGGRVDRKKQHHRASGRTENRRDDKAENDTTTSLGGVQSHRLPKKKNHPPEKRPRKQQYHHREKKDREGSSAEHQEKSSKTLDVATHTAAGPVQDSVTQIVHEESMPSLRPSTTDEATAPRPETVVLGRRQSIMKIPGTARKASAVGFGNDACLT
ncbi:hypothetical protein ISCGN_009010 [Ixodes scapularis]